MDTNLIKNAIINTKVSIAREQQTKPKSVDNNGGLLSRTKSATMSDNQQENDSIRLAKMIKGKFNNA
tara:strand:+ start:935 stop:1135 length:201 start_codon:yes stop_codon:yes gene_type:complete